MGGSRAVIQDPLVQTFLSNRIYQRQDTALADHLVLLVLFCSF